jgi:S-adenosylmethionine-dependent methyltransferase
VGGRGRLRFELLMDQVKAALPPPPAQVVDAGGGTGQVAVPLAVLGYQVTVVDTSAAMLATCAERAEEGGATLAIVQGDAAEVAALLGTASQDAALCHDLLGDVAEPLELLCALAEVLQPDGVLSLTFLNRDWLTLRAGRRGEFADALHLLDEHRGRTMPEVLPWLDRAGFDLVEAFGVSVFAASAADDLDRTALTRLAELERRVAGREPYRSSAHTLHLIGKRRTHSSRLG